MNKDSKIYIAGHRGLVGSAIVRKLREQGFRPQSSALSPGLILRTHAELDLTDQHAVRVFFETEKPEYVFLAAAKVGGILANNTYPAEFIHQNLAIQTNVIHEAYKAGVKRLLFLGSSCIYPRDCPQPMKEEYLLTGPLESTNRSYAVAKIAGIEMCWAYNRQYGTHYLAVMPTNLYGPRDNYDLQKSHVLPALIRKFHLAKLALNKDWDAIAKDEIKNGPIPDEIKAGLGFQNKGENNLPSVVLWGTGAPYREFLYSDDMADACVYLMSLPDEQYATLLSNEIVPLVNIGCGQDMTIREVAALVAKVIGYSGNVVFDASKPDGTKRKVLDVSRLSTLGWRPRTIMEAGIAAAYQEYLTR